MGPGPPEYDNITWFALILSSSAGTGLFFYGAKEPLFFYTAPNRLKFECSLMNESFIDSILG